MFTRIFLFHQRTIPTGLGKHAVNGHSSHPERKLRNGQQKPNLGSPYDPCFALGFRTASGCSWCRRKPPVAFGCPPRSAWGASEATLGTVPEPPRPGTNHGTTSHTLCPWRVPGHLRTCHLIYKTSMGWVRMPDAGPTAQGLPPSKMIAVITLMVPENVLVSCLLGD